MTSHSCNSFNSLNNFFSPSNLASEIPDSAITLNSFLHAFSIKYDDEFLRAKWYDNTKFLAKMFASLNIKYENHLIDKQQSQYLDIDVLEYSSNKNIGLLVSTTTKERDVMEYFIGVQEDRTIVNEYKIPILYLNPREDLYVLCD